MKIFEQQLIFIVILISTILTASAARSTNMLIVPDSRSGVAGQTIQFKVYAYNDEAEEMVAYLPHQLICDFKSGEHTAKGIAIALFSEKKMRYVVEPNRFARKHYVCRLPAGLHGPVRMHVSEINAPDIMLTVNTTAHTEEPSNTNKAKEEYVSLDSLFYLYQPYLVNISAYEPIYFLVGANPEKSTFQFSFKYQFFNVNNPVVANHSWLKGFHFGFTQTSFWDLKSDSAPFKDSSYKPELFYLTPNVRKSSGRLVGIFFQTGLQHESNGQAAAFSRSTNYFYAKPFFIFYDKASTLGLQIAPKVWTYVENDHETNHDLDKYRGYFELELKCGKADGAVLGSHLRWAEKGASARLDLTYPMSKVISKNVNIYLHMQYNTSLAESLINYQKRVQIFRLGVAIVR